MPVAVDRARLRELIDDGAQLVEVLPRQDYEAEHLPGAVNLSLRELNATTISGLDKRRPVIVYCYDCQ